MTPIPTCISRCLFLYNCEILLDRFIAKLFSIDWSEYTFFFTPSIANIYILLVSTCTCCLCGLYCPLLGTYSTLIPGLCTCVWTLSHSGYERLLNGTNELCSTILPQCIEYSLPARQRVQQGYSSLDLEASSTGDFNSSPVIKDWFRPGTEMAGDCNLWPNNRIHQSTLSGGKTIISTRIRILGVRVLYYTFKMGFMFIHRHHSNMSYGMHHPLKFFSQEVT